METISLNTFNKSHYSGEQKSKAEVLRAYLNDLTFSAGRLPSFFRDVVGCFDITSREQVRVFRRTAFMVDLLDADDYIVRVQLSQKPIEGGGSQLTLTFYAGQMDEDDNTLAQPYAIDVKVGSGLHQSRVEDYDVETLIRDYHFNRPCFSEYQRTGYNNYIVQLEGVFNHPQWQLTLNPRDLEML